MTTAFPKEKQNRVRRHPERGQYSREQIYPIVDAALLCHVGFVLDDQPFVIPVLHARDGDTLLLHGSSASRLMQHAGAGGNLCVTVTHVDGLVLARSAFNHSINYRSAVLYGTGALITDQGEKMAALATFTERLLPGRWADARVPTTKELRSTAVVRMTISSGSAKVRSGPPKDDSDDLGLPVWAGVVPVSQHLGEPIPDEQLAAETPVPEYLRKFIKANQ